MAASPAPVSRASAAAPGAAVPGSPSPLRSSLPAAAGAAPFLATGVTRSATEGASKRAAGRLGVTTPHPSSAASPFSAGTPVGGGTRINPFRPQGRSSRGRSEGSERGLPIRAGLGDVFKNLAEAVDKSVSQQTWSMSANTAFKHLYKAEIKEDRDLIKRVVKQTAKRNAEAEFPSIPLLHGEDFENLTMEDILNSIGAFQPWMEDMMGTYYKELLASLVRETGVLRMEYFSMKTLGVGNYKPMLVYPIKSSKSERGEPPAWWTLYVVQLSERRIMYNITLVSPSTAGHALHHETKVSGVAMDADELPDVGTMRGMALLLEHEVQIKITPLGISDDEFLGEEAYLRPDLPDDLPPLPAVSLKAQRYDPVGRPIVSLVAGNTMCAVVDFPEEDLESVYQIEIRFPRVAEYAVGDMHAFESRFGNYLSGCLPPAMPLAPEGARLAFTQQDAFNTIDLALRAAMGRVKYDYKAMFDKETSKGVREGLLPGEGTEGASANETKDNRAAMISVFADEDTDWLVAQNKALPVTVPVMVPVLVPGKVSRIQHVMGDASALPVDESALSPLYLRGLGRAAHPGAAGGQPARRGFKGAASSGGFGGGRRGGGRGKSGRGGGKKDRKGAGNKKEEQARLDIRDMGNKGKSYLEKIQQLTEEAESLVLRSAYPGSDGTRDVEGVLAGATAGYAEERARGPIPQYLHLALLEAVRGIALDLREEVDRVYVVLETGLLGLDVALSVEGIREKFLALHGPEAAADWATYMSGMGLEHTLGWKLLGSLGFEVIIRDTSPSVTVFYYNGKEFRSIADVFLALPENENPLFVWAHLPGATNGSESNNIAVAPYIPADVPETSTGYNLLGLMMYARMYTPPATIDTSTLNAMLLAKLAENRGMNVRTAKLHFFEVAVPVNVDDALPPGAGPEEARNISYFWEAVTRGVEDASNRTRKIAHGGYSDLAGFHGVMDAFKSAKADALAAADMGPIEAFLDKLDESGMNKYGGGALREREVPQVQAAIDQLLSKKLKASKDAKRALLREQFAALLAAAQEAPEDPAGAAEELQRVAGKLMGDASKKSLAAAEAVVRLLLADAELGRIVGAGAAAPEEELERGARLAAEEDLREVAGSALAQRVQAASEDLATRLEGLRARRKVFASLALVQVGAQEAARKAVRTDAEGRLELPETDDLDELMCRISALEEAISTAEYEVKRAGARGAGEGGGGPDSAGMAALDEARAALPRLACTARMLDAVSLFDIALLTETIREGEELGGDEVGLPVEAARKEVAEIQRTLQQMRRSRVDPAPEPSLEPAAPPEPEAPQQYTASAARESIRSVGNKICYDETEILGQGSLQTYVFAGTWQETSRRSRPAAIKRIIKRPGEGGVQQVRLIEREVELNLDLSQSPRMVQFFGWDQDDTYVCLAAELCKQTLRSYMAELMGGAEALEDLALSPEQTLPPVSREGLEERRRVMREAAEGVAYLHSPGKPQGVVAHNDIKPENILLTAAAEVKIADVGLSVKVEADSAQFSLSSFRDFGVEVNLARRAPEVVRSEAAGQFTTAVDVWALGYVFYYVLTGLESPFARGAAARLEQEQALLEGAGGKRMSPQAAMQRIRALENELIALGQCDTSALGEAIPSTSAALEARDLLEAMLAAAPEMRPSMEAVLRHPLFWGEEEAAMQCKQLNEALKGRDKAAARRLALAVAGTPGAEAMSQWVGAVHPRLLEAEVPGVTFRTYGGGVGELVRFVRNKWEHPPREDDLLLATAVAGLRGDVGPGPFKTNEARRALLITYVRHLFPHLMVIVFRILDDEYQ